MISEKDTILRGKSFSTFGSLRHIKSTDLAPLLEQFHGRCSGDPD